MHSHCYRLNEARVNPISSYHLDVRLNAALEWVPNRTQRLLDIGCGEGYFLQKLLSQRKSIQAFGVDISQTNLNFAKKHIPDAKFLLAPAEKLPFKTAFFDCITCLEVLDHLPKPEKPIREIYRVLKPDGTFILSIPSYDNPLWPPIWKLWTWTLGRKWRHAHIQGFNQTSIQPLLRKMGFTDIKKQTAFFGLIIVISCQRKKTE